MECISFKPIADKIKNSDNFLIFMIGDSITWGAHASSAEKTYTAVFAQKLAEKFGGRDKDGNLVYDIDYSTVYSSGGSHSHTVNLRGSLESVASEEDKW